MRKKPVINPPVYLLATLAAMWLLDRYLPMHRVVQPPLAYIGVLPVLLGIYVSAASSRLFTGAGTGVRPLEGATVLVTGGFYRYSRNPMYLGMFAMLTGVVVLLGSVGALAAALPFVLIIRNGFVLPEERYMESVFGRAYLDYKARVRRWL